MKKLLGYILEFQRKHFDLKLYLITAVFISCWITFNYWFDFEDSYLDPLRGSSWHWPAMFGWMLIPFLGVVGILILSGKVDNVFKRKRFWLMALIGFAIISADRTFNWYHMARSGMNAVDYRFFARCANWSISLFVTVLPLLLVYRIFESEQPRSYYGLSRQNTDLKPYFQLLFLAIILIGIGSFFGDIKAYYPRYQHSGGNRFAEAHDLPIWFSVLIYELCYGSDFVSVELFFRGFLIHAFVKMLGGYAVLPMVATYAFLHFGKPLTETISSVFGGYILGVVSYKTNNVWGGIIIHMGVAWSMEIFGYLQSLF